MSLYDIIYYSVCGLFLVVSMIIGVHEKVKQKNISKLEALYECIPNAVINAEKIFTEKGQGEKKKHLVMTELVNIALTSKTKYDYAELDKRVESVVKATKNVNVPVESVDETFCETEQQIEQPVIESRIVQPIVEDGSITVEVNNEIRKGE